MCTLVSDSPVNCVPTQYLVPCYSTVKDQGFIHEDHMKGTNLHNRVGEFIKNVTFIQYENYYYQEIFIRTRGGVSVGAVGAIAPTVFDESLIVT